AWALGMRERIGFGQNPSRWLTQVVVKHRPQIHMVDRFLRIVGESGGRVDRKATYRVHVPGTDRQRAEAWCRQIQTPFVCLHLGGQWPRKRWPVPHFVALAQRLMQDGYAIVLTGGADDRTLGALFKQAILDARIVDLIGQLSLGEVAALYKRGGFFVGEP